MRSSLEAEHTRYENRQTVCVGRSVRILQRDRDGSRDVTCDGLSARCV